MKCLSCGEELVYTDVVVCKQCGIIYVKRIPQKTQRWATEISSSSEQIKGLKDLIQCLKENIEMNYMVEVGTWLGASALQFSEEFRKVFCVDHWNVNTNIPKVFEGCRFNFRDKPNIAMIREYSRNATKNIDDGTLDFVYIDADHRPEFVKEDIELWLPKIKKGGAIGGHDYGRGNEEGVFDFTGLTNVVNEKFKDYEIKTFCDGSWLVFLK